MAQPSTLLRHPGFLQLWGARTVSIVGNRITELALPLTAIGLLGASAFEVGLLVAAQYVPYLIIGLPAGAWIDRLRRRPVMIVADAVRCCVLLVVPLTAVAGMLQLWVLFPVAVTVGVMGVFFELAAQSYLPTLIGTRHLVEGNTKMELSRTAGELTGPGIGGLLVQWLTAPFAILADAATFAISGLALLLIREKEPPPPPRKTDSSLIAEIRTGLRAVFANPLLRPLALTGALANLFGFSGVLQAVLVLYCVRELQFSPFMLGAVLAGGNAGFLIGALLNRRMTSRFGIGPVMAGSITATGAGVAILPLASGGPMAGVVVVIGLVLIGAGIAAFNINQVSLRQSVTRPELLGRMTATFRFVNWGAVPIGALLGGALAGVIGIRAVLLLAAAGSLIAAVPLLLSPIRVLWEMPQGALDPQPVPAPFS
ncbi:MFS transporter [Nocardia vinacea]|uniref:MFS transporter n=1 Tax=Nocardia vinacea TaxID=96468 RepID=A0ABZ1Z1K4_9NOCA|nr:MFS transporter [Nocardia vinacea]